MRILDRVLALNAENKANIAEGVPITLPGFYCAAQASTQTARLLGLQRFAQLPKSNEVGPSLLRIFGKRRNGHKSVKTKSAELGH